MNSQQILEKYQNPTLQLNKLFANPEKYIQTRIVVGGWVINCRAQTDCLFVILTDGTTLDSLQIVVDAEKESQNFNYLKYHASKGATLKVSGILIDSMASEQDYELQEVEILYLGEITQRNRFLASSKKTSLETVRHYPHVRPLFTYYQSVYRLRKQLFREVSNFFDYHDFKQLDPNLITLNDCEGAGETFKVQPQSFFKQDAFLTVSSQLQLEALSRGMGNVFTLNPSFRAEKSNSSRHLASFCHLEYEMPFISLDNLLDFTEFLVRYLIASLLENPETRKDLDYLDSKYCQNLLIEKLENVRDNNFTRVTYQEALDIIDQNQETIKEKYSEFQKPNWGDDLDSSSEKYLATDYYKKPVFVTNYPQSLGSFYMKASSDGSTWENCDLLFPHLGEIVGGSMREDDPEKLANRLPSDKLNWYLDLRKNGTFEHGGAGMGLERLLLFLTSMSGNIRDVVPFPISFREIKY